MKRIYLDHNATTPVHPAVLDAMLPYLGELFGNPSSTSRFGQQARRAVDLARQQVAGLLGAEPAEIVFGSGGTEANNHAIRGAVEATGKGHVITSAVEHHSVLHTGEYLQRLGHRVTFLPVDGDGLVDPADVERAIDDDTALVTVMLANNEVGTIQPIADIARVAREAGVWMHTDAVQGVGKLAVDVNSLGVDLASISGHKLHGPKGIGALYCRRGVRVAPLLHGGRHESKQRAGTENVPAIVGFGKACDLAGEALGEGLTGVTALRDRLQAELLAQIPAMRINGHPQRRIPNTLNVSFDEVDGEMITMNLDVLGIAASNGSACSAGSVEPSHVLQAMGHTRQQASTSVRFSLGSETTVDEVDRTVAAVVEVVTRLRTA